MNDKRPQHAAHSSGDASSSAPATPSTGANGGMLHQGAAYGLILGAFCAVGLLLAAPMMREWLFAVLPESQRAHQRQTADLRQLRQEVRKGEKRLALLRARSERLLPREPYLIVDTSENQIQVMSGRRQLHQGKCSTGSYVLLKAADRRQWIFQTPRGMFRVLAKEESPVWRKPDWAFIEEGLPVPPEGSPERFEYGVLGDYALALGDGYLIHGTLYKRLLGMPVTHGCVRLDDKELRIVYQNLQIGSKVFIY